MRISLDEEPKLKSYMDESSLKAPIQMDSTLVPSFEETMEVHVQVQEEKKPAMFQEEAKEKKMRSFWILKKRKLNQIPT